MWLSNFDQRLASWYNLRKSAQTQTPHLALQTINSWWFQTPWRSYYLHWDDLQTWPDPWQLLSDNVYCEVARGLGILYTITLLEREDLTGARLVLTQSGHNLVLVDQTKYILNWDTNDIVNTIQEVAVHRQLTQEQIKINIT